VGADGRAPASPARVQATESEVYPDRRLLVFLLPGAAGPANGLGALQGAERGPSLLAIHEPMACLPSLSKVADLATASQFSRTRTIVHWQLVRSHSRGLVSAFAVATRGTISTASANFAGTSCANHSVGLGARRRCRLPPGSVPGAGHLRRIARRGRSSRGHSARPFGTMLNLTKRWRTPSGSQRGRPCADYRLISMFAHSSLAPSRKRQAVRGPRGNQEADQPVLHAREGMIRPRPSRSTKPGNALWRGWTGRRSEGKMTVAIPDGRAVTRRPVAPDCQFSGARLRRLVSSPTIGNTSIGIFF